MKTTILCGAAALPMLLAIAPAPAHAETAEDDALTDTIIVSGRRVPVSVEETEPVAGHGTAADAAALVAHLPGAGLINNGAVSGQVQFRGLFSERLAIRVGGQSFQSGGPNAMDPPLHYAPTILLDTIKVSRGVAPVSAGPGMGALVDANLKQAGFGDGPGIAPIVDVAVSYRSADDGIAVGGIAGLASDSVRLNAIAAWEDGNDYRIPGGRAAGTAYERLTFGLSAGFRAADNTLSLDLRRSETGESGNPPFPMDILYFDTNFARLAFDGAIAGNPVKIALGYAGVRHEMDNFSMRPPPPGPMRYRRTYAEADTFTANASVELGILELGTDAEWVDRLAVIRNTEMPAFYIAAFDTVRQRRLGGFAQVAGALGGWQGDLGLRVDRHRAQMANPATGPAVPAMVQMLAGATAAGNARRSNTTVDAALRVWRDSGFVRPRITLSRKTRVPNAIERFGWLPIEASGGLADRNIYIGDQTLKPEVAYAVEAGADIGSNTFSLRPSVFYRRIDDYIQGVPVPAGLSLQRMIAAMNGDDTPLRFANVDAEFYGFDADIGWQILPVLRLDALASYVRGKRRDVADNLYRIAPLNGRASLTYGAESWSLTAEVVGALKQEKVSLTNEETGSPGWLVANLWFDYAFGGGVRLSGGVENLFDRRYADHLAGVNRIAGSEVAIGERLPAVGRSAFVRLGVRY